MDWEEFYRYLKSRDPAERGRLTEEFVEARGEYRKEDHHVELKEYHLRERKIDSPTKGNLAKEASAFANADGGLIIWGFKDDASSKPITDANDAMRTLSNLGAECTQPSIDRIETTEALLGTEGRQGYAVTYVPRSGSAPHQAAMGPEKVSRKYFRRSGGRARAMQHGELDDMFGRRPRPYILPAIRLHRLSDGDLIMTWRAENSGAALGFGVTLDASFKLNRQHTEQYVIAGADFGMHTQSLIHQVPRPRRRHEKRGVIAEFYVPLNGPPIRSHGGQLELMEVRFHWRAVEPKLEDVVGPIEFRIEWILGAYNMRPLSSLYLIDFAPHTKSSPLDCLTPELPSAWIPGTPDEPKLILREDLYS